MGEYAQHDIERRLCNKLIEPARTLCRGERLIVVANVLAEVEQSSSHSIDPYCTGTTGDIHAQLGDTSARWDDVEAKMRVPPTLPSFQAMCAEETMQNSAPVNGVYSLCVCDPLADTVLRVLVRFTAAVELPPAGAQALHAEASATTAAGALARGARVGASPTPSLLALFRCPGTRARSGAAKESSGPCQVQRPERHSDEHVRRWAYVVGSDAIRPPSDKVLGGAALCYWS
ncbi:hypothetical protein MRX96_041569 [Rhipicephalus microplus]